MYQQIKQHLETKLYTLPPRVQGHYALRQFRMTGDTEYANGVLVDLITVSERQNFYACQLDNKDFVAKQGQILRDNLGKGPRAKARRVATEKYPDFVLLNDVVLRYASRIDEVGFIGPCHNKMQAALKQSDLKTAYTDPDMIRSWAAQLVNYVYWAKQMGITDLRQPYTQAFNSTYPNSADAKLSKAQYKNKIYGMTHFIFAASGYYQHYVDEKEFQWILSYFEKNIDRILTDTTEDIITEVGISFQITGNADNPVVEKVKQHLLKVYSPTHRMLLSPSGKAHLATGEHRNILAMMLLKWPETLHPGPYLNEIKSIQKNLPMTVSPK
ncbi:DUF3541 domain-containing protein [Shewanella intestini]|uniref:DUF3541 domain-containing protein n=2 Tax=Shewanellaceae TaxID=267890 RepID=A0ABS5I2F9_9GAMM|nr:DUF3541 domain-containing protein [Shewanella intestini]MRG36133.1 DUF3541 domain-containing protein [Shewanella sp. XMDDZSB0408]